MLDRVLDERLQHRGRKRARGERRGRVDRPGEARAHPHRDEIEVGTHARQLVAER
jgi:hypothetical protein